MNQGDADSRPKGVEVLDAHLLDTSAVGQIGAAFWAAVVPI
jgi:hypothetical protein